jgi:hypothetical protein
MIKSRKMRLEGNVARGEKSGMDAGFGGNVEGKSPLGRPKLNRKHNNETDRT